MSNKKVPMFGEDKNNARSQDTPFDPTAPTDPNNPDEPDLGDQDKNSEDADPQLKQIIETGSISISKGRHLIHCLTIIGQIEGHFILPPQEQDHRILSMLFPKSLRLKKTLILKGCLSY